MFIEVSESVLKELEEAAGKPADSESPLGSLYISQAVPASCIRLKVPLDDFLCHVTALQGFKQRFKVLPVRNRRFDIVILGDLTLDGAALVLDGRPAQLL